MTLASDVELAAQAWVVVLSAVLLILSIAAFSRSRNKRILGLTVAFSVFLVKGVLSVLSLFQWNPLPWEFLTPPILDTAILLSIYVATLRPR